MSDLTSIQASSLATEITLAKNYATNSVTMVVSLKSEVQTLKSDYEILKNRFNQLLDLLKNVDISDSSLNELKINNL
jgi:hypothetical protein